MKLVNQGWQNPQLHEKVYAAGSIDHENRGKTRYFYFWGLKISYWDSDWFSWKDTHSGSADYLYNNCNPEPTWSFCSGYGDNIERGNQALDFVMPGNGVPVPITSLSTWVYGKGTSFSSPYLAAAALIAVYGYNKGYYAKGLEYKDPSANEIYNILQAVAINTFSTSLDWHQYYGYGYINVNNAYNYAYDLGYANAPAFYCDYWMRQLGIC